MGYELGITEVGPAEYPLIEVLRETILSEFGHRSLSTLEEDLRGQQDILCLIAHLEGNPVGFKVGHRDRKDVYYSKSGGVLKDYRRLGLGTRMHEWQLQFAKSHGYERIWFNTFPHFKDMIRFGLRHGFLPVGIEQRELGRFSWKFALGLNQSISVPINARGIHNGGKSITLSHRDSAALLGAIESGYQMIGLYYDFEAGSMMVELEHGRESESGRVGVE